MFGLSLAALAVGFAAGLVCGWVLIPQPGFIKRIFG